MGNFSAPVVGKQVSVTTRYRENYLFASTPYVDYHYDGVVGKPDKSVPVGSFMLLTPDDKKMPTRVISLRNVVELTYHDGSTASTQSVQTRVYQIQGSKGNVYTVTEVNGVKTCTCPGFSWRKTCKHII